MEQEKKQKTIIVLSTHVQLWGAEKSMCSVLTYFQQRGFRVVLIISQHGEIESLLRSEGIEYYISRLTTSCDMSYTRYSLSTKILLYLRFWKGFIVDSSRIQRLLKKNDIKPDIIYSNTIIPSNGVFLANFLKIPHVVHVREITGDDFPVRFHIGKQRYLKLLSNSLSYAICISDIVKDRFSDVFGDKAVKIYNGLPIRECIDSKKLSQADGLTHILFIGRLSSEKGVLNLFHAIRNLRDDHYCSGKFILHVFGKGRDQELLNTYIKDNLLQNNIILHGYCNNIDPSIYDISIMSSPHEAFGRTTVEYMMAGLPVIGMNGGATPEIVSSGETGYLYNTIDELTYYIKKLIVEKENRQSMGRAGRERAVSLFSENRYCNEVYHLIKSLV